MSVQTLTSLSDFKALKESESLVVFDFSASWCGPCRVIAPRVDELAAIYGRVRFYKIDVDESPDIAALAGVSAMPTFQFYKGNRLVESVVGADVAMLKKHLAEFA